MEIQNLTSKPTVNPITPPVINNTNPIKPNKVSKNTVFSLPFFLIFLVLGITAGFWASRLIKRNSGSLGNSIFKQEAISTDNIETVEVGKLYGNEGKNFKDTATGVLEKGSLNGEGTHILNREGGKDQRAALTSSTVDLDLFINKKVEIKGETNSSNKVGWFLDVGTIKILE